MKNDDTVITLIGLVLGSAFAIYLFNWPDVVAGNFQEDENEIA